VKQQTLASQAVFEKYGRKSRRELFLDEQVVPWSGLQSLVEPHYAKAGNGRRPVGLGIMLRTYFVQQWFNLSDPGVEEALYESAALRRFVGVDLGVAPAPDETTICSFRHLEGKGIRIATGTIVDATIIHAPSSTKNQSGERDPEMRQTRKGSQWCVSRTRAQARDAVLKMGDGLPESAYRSRLQTARCCCVQKAW
jgi:transposase, IS5 family